jgi:hypothetical protein
MAAPDKHTVLSENERLHIVHTLILPEQAVPVHTHCWPSVLFILSWSDLVRRDYLVNVMLDTRQALEVRKLNTPSCLEPLPPH